MPAAASFTQDPGFFPIPAAGLWRPAAGLRVLVVDMFKLVFAPSVPSYSASSQTTN